MDSETLSLLQWENKIKTCSNTKLRLTVLRNCKVKSWLVLSNQYRLRIYTGEGKGRNQNIYTHINIYIYMHLYYYTHIYIYTYIYIGIQEDSHSFWKVSALISLLKSRALLPLWTFIKDSYLRIISFKRDFLAKKIY